MNEKEQWDAWVFGPAEGDKGHCGRPWEFIRMGEGSPFIVYCTDAWVLALLSTCWAQVQVICESEKPICVYKASPKPSTHTADAAQAALTRFVRFRIWDRFQSSSTSQGHPDPRQDVECSAQVQHCRNRWAFLFLHFCFIFQDKHFLNIAQKMSMIKQFIIIYLKF